MSVVPFPTGCAVAGCRKAAGHAVLRDFAEGDRIRLELACADHAPDDGPAFSNPKASTVTAPLGFRGWRHILWPYVEDCADRTARKRIKAELMKVAG
jgi:hypothetical protein